MRLSKTDIAKKLKEAYPNDIQSAAAAKRITDGLFQIMADELSQGNEVAAIGFGTFTIKDRAAREYSSLSTGEKIMSPAHKTVGFKVSSTLKDALNG